MGKNSRVQGGSIYFFWKLQNKVTIFFYSRYLLKILIDFIILMTQNKKHSLIESATQTIIGLVKNLSQVITKLTKRINI